MATIKGTITDRKSGKPAACTVHVLSSDGGFAHPDGAVLKEIFAHTSRDFFAGL